MTSKHKSYADVLKTGTAAEVSGSFSKEKLCFQILGSTHVLPEVRSTLYESLFSGCRVQIIDYPSTDVHVQILVGTAIENNYGITHALEHLILKVNNKGAGYDPFYKVTNGNGYFNAYVSSIHTNFEYCTDGAEGSLKLLPIYLDRIFNPVLTESMYKVEVHAVNGNGRDVGVVYSEISGRCRKANAKLRELMNDRHPAFAYNCGGTPADIRENCTLERIRAYHKKYYKMENTGIIVAGKVSHDTLLKLLSQFETENNFAKTGKIPRPLQNATTKPFKQTVERVYTMSNDSRIEIFIVWKGTNPLDCDECAVNVLLTYLTLVIGKHFVAETASVHYSGVEPFYGNLNLAFKFFANPEHLRQLNGNALPMKLLSFIRNHKIDMKLLRLLTFNPLSFSRKHNRFAHIAQHFVRYLWCAPEEKDPNFTIPAVQYSILKTKDLDFWNKLVAKYFTEDYIFLCAVPGKQLIRKHNESESNRYKSRIRQLGVQGLQKLDEDIEKAVAANERETTAERMPFRIAADVEHKPGSIAKRSISKQRFGKSESTAPLIVHQVASSVTILKLIFDAKNIPKQYHPLLYLYAPLIHANSTIDKQVETYDHNQGVSLPKSLLSFRAPQTDSEIFDRFTMGDGYMSIHHKNGVFTIITTINPSDARLIGPFLFFQFFNDTFRKETVERVLKEIIAEAEACRNHSNLLLSRLVSHLVVKPCPISHNFIKIPVLYQKLLENMQDEEFAKNVLSQLTELGGLLSTSPSNVHLIGNPTLIKTISFDNWPQFQGDVILVNDPHASYDYSQSAGTVYCITRDDCVSPEFRQMTKVLFSTNAVESVYSSILNEYFGNLHFGLAYSAVRNRGLAYDISLKTLNSGLQFNISSPSDLIGTYNCVKKVVTDAIKSGKLDEQLFDMAKTASSNLYSNKFIKTRAETDSFSIHMDGFGVDNNFHEIQARRINAATAETVLKSIGKYYLNLFDESHSCTAMIVPKYMKGAVRDAFPHAKFNTVTGFYEDVQLNCQDF